MFKVVVALLVGTAPLAAAAAACGADLRGAQQLESADYVVAYRTQPPKIAIGKHFSIDFVVCGKGASVAAAEVAVDAYMPEHGHGMNYRAVVKSSRNPQPASAAGAHFRADGLMFHMPGRWDLYFDVRNAGKTERLTRSIVLE